MLDGRNAGMGALIDLGILYLTSAGTSVTGNVPKKDQPSEAQLSLPTCTQRKASKRGTHPLLNFQSYSHTQGGTKEGDGTPSFQRHTMFKLYPNFEGNRPANSTQKDMSFTSLPFCNTTRAPWLFAPLCCGTVVLHLHQGCPLGICLTRCVLASGSDVQAKHFGE